MRFPVNEVLQWDNVTAMQGFPDGCIDLTVTSPPYDKLRDYKGHSFDFEALVKELFRITKIGGVVVWVVGDATIQGNETGTSFKQALYFKEIGFNLNDTMIYLKTGAVGFYKNRYTPGFEYMFIFSKGEIITFNPIKDKANSKAGQKLWLTRREKDGSLKPRISDKRVPEFSLRPNYWLYPPTQVGIKNRHPATFPLQLAEDHILSWSNPGDTVLDPFIGSGTTAVAAIKNGRNFIGIEISEEYCLLAKERIQQELQEKKNESDS